ncbi:MAG: polymer-forming cytoskeletal protein [Oscillospiraceae bacterium]
MSAKDNFAQAMKELLNSPEAGGEDFEEKKPMSSSFSSFSQPEAKPQRTAAPKAESAPQRAQQQPAYSQAPEKPAYTQPTYTPPAPAPRPAPTPYTPAPAPTYIPPQPVAAPAPAPAPMAPPMPAPADVEPTVLAPGTTVVGDVTTAGGLRIGGSVKGNLRSAGAFELNGKVIGDIEAAEAVIVGSLIRGNVNLLGTLTMDAETTIVGDVSAKTIECDGKIKGNVTIADRSHFLPNAILVGNLMSGTIIIDEGAMLKGDMSITSAPADAITVDDPDFDIGF